MSAISDKRPTIPTGARAQARTLLADDHDLVRSGLRRLLERIAEVTIAAEAGDGEEVLAILRRQQLDLVLLDISMPGLDGLQALARIRREFPLVTVIILSMHQNSEYACEAIRLGANGYLLKRDSIAELERAVKAVLRGETYLSAGVSRGLLRESFNAPRRLLNRSLECLSPRQREILQLMAEGKTTHGIALALNISAKTVEYHRSQLMKCLNIFDVPGLVRFAAQEGLVGLDA